MYHIEDLEKNVPSRTWSSDKHRKVAILSCVCNPRVDSLSKLLKNLVMINSIPFDQIDNASPELLVEWGCTI